MSVAISDIRDVAPEFRDTSGYPDSKIQPSLTRAISQVSAEAWGTSVDEGVKYLAAHFLAVSNPQSSQTTKIRVYETPGAEDAGELGTTRYGIEFVRLRNSQRGCRMPFTA